MPQAAHRVSSWNTAPGSLDYPLVIAHRGGSGGAPENTLEAFRRAVDAGADAIELDVRLPRDGHLAVIHDRRVDRTTSGTGVIGKLTLAEIKEFDAGSWFGPDFKSARVPTLDEVFEEVPRSFPVNVELKVRNHMVKRLASAVVETVLRHRRLESTTVAIQPAGTSGARDIRCRCGPDGSARWPARTGWGLPCIPSPRSCCNGSTARASSCWRGTRTLGPTSSTWQTWVWTA